MMKRLSLLALPFLLVACASPQQTMEDDMQPPPAPPPPPTATTYDNDRRTSNDEDVMTAEDQTIAALAMNTPELSMLVEALQKAGLAETLMGDGPFTVFAPTNEAFDAADAEDMSADELKNLLLYHVVEGKYEAGDFNEGMMIKTMSGDEVGMNYDATDPTVLTVQQVAIVAPDIEASNGVVHVINAVLLPEGGVPLGGSE